MQMLSKAIAPAMPHHVFLDFILQPPWVKNLLISNFIMTVFVRKRKKKEVGKTKSFPGCEDLHVALAHSFLANIAGDTLAYKCIVVVMKKLTTMTMPTSNHITVEIKPISSQKSRMLRRSFLSFCLSLSDIFPSQCCNAKLWRL